MLEGCIRGIFGRHFWREQFALEGAARQEKSVIEIIMLEE